MVNSIRKLQALGCAVAVCSRCPGGCLLQAHVRISGIARPVTLQGEIRVATGRIVAEEQSYLWSDTKDFAGVCGLIPRISLVSAAGLLAGGKGR